MRLHAARLLVLARDAGPVYFIDHGFRNFPKWWSDRPRTQQKANADKASLATLRRCTCTATQDRLTKPSTGKTPFRSFQ